MNDEGWNGEKWFGCWEVSKNDLTKIIKDNITIVAEYSKIDDDTFIISNLAIDY